MRAILQSPHKFRRCFLKTIKDPEMQMLFRLVFYLLAALVTLTIFLGTGLSMADRIAANLPCDSSKQELHSRLKTFG